MAEEKQEKHLSFSGQESEKLAYAYWLLEERENLVLEMKRDLSRTKKERQKDTAALEKALQEKETRILELEKSRPDIDEERLNELTDLADRAHEQDDEIKLLRRNILELEKRLESRSEKRIEYKDLQAKNQHLESENRRLQEKLVLQSQGEAVDVGDIQWKDTYKKALDDLKTLVQKNIAVSNETQNDIISRLRENYRQLRDKQADIEEFYQDLISGIAEKQGKAKGFIRHAVNDLQEALDLLDLNAAHYARPRLHADAFNHLLDTSDDLFDEYKQRLAKEGGTDPGVLIEHIENLYMDLESGMPAGRIIEGSLDDGSGEKKIGTSGVFCPLAGRSPSVVNNYYGTPGLVDDGAMPDRRDGQDRRDSDNRRALEDRRKDDDRRTGEGRRKADKGPPDGIERRKEDRRTGKERRDDERRDEEDRREEKDRRDEEGQKESGAEPQGSPEAGKGEEEDEERFKEVEPSNAPYEWKNIPGNLSKYVEILKRAKALEAAGEFIKAVNLYESIREQPSIQSDRIVQRMLEEHIKWCEDRATEQYGINFQHKVPV